MLYFILTLMICKIKISEKNDKKGCELTQPHDHKTSATTNEDSMGKKFHFKKIDTNRW